jgi:uncharacterized protein YdaU (DUF1376 family)
VRQSAHKAYLPLFAGDYLADTLNFSVEEHGAYLLALIHQWNSGPFEEDELRLVLRFQRKKFAKIFAKLSPKLTQAEDGKWYSKRLEAERAKSLEISEKRSKAGRLGAESKWNSDDGNCHDFAIGKTMAPTQPNNINNKVIKNTAAAVSNSRYVFSGRVVRLNQKDFERLSDQFSHIPDFVGTLSYADGICLNEKLGANYFPRLLSILNHQNNKFAKGPDPKPIMRSAI